MTKPRKKFHIRCEMEGVSGVVHIDQVTPGAREYPESRLVFMAELLALIERLRAGGADEIFIYDEHWSGRNIDLARLPKGVIAICGKPPYRPDWRGGLDESHTGMILHGLHSREGAGHTLSHTYEPDFAAITIHGQAVGEIGVETAVAGDCGVPLVLVVADSAGAEEAAQLVPGVTTVATKISQGDSGAECFALATNLDPIRAAGEQAGRHTTAPPPWRVASPVDMRFSFKPGACLTALRKQAAANFSSDDTLRLTGSSVTEIWADYWQRKLRVQKSLGAP